MGRYYITAYRTPFRLHGVLRCGVAHDDIADDRRPQCLRSGVSNLITRVRFSCELVDLAISIQIERCRVSELGEKWLLRRWPPRGQY